LLNYAPMAEWIDVGKQPDRHPVSQERINDILVDQARQGKVVVRLKGGDPFVFGRGGEEAWALHHAGVPFEIVPGVTSAVAAPAYAGIPVTQRGTACSAAILTGHRSDCGPDPAADWRRAAIGSDTLIFLMGVQNLPRIVHELLEAGREVSTPVALIANATSPRQKIVTGTLENIIQRAKEISPPAVIVVGQVVELHETLDWFNQPSRRPLLGVRVIDTRPDLSITAFPRSCKFSHPVLSGRSDPITQGLEDMGAEVFGVPALQVNPVQRSLEIVEILQEWKKKARSGEGNGRREAWIVYPDSESIHAVMDALFDAGKDARFFAGLRVATTAYRLQEELIQYGLAADELIQLDRHPAIQAEKFCNATAFLPIQESTWMNAFPIDSQDPYTKTLEWLKGCAAQVRSFPAYQVSPALLFEEDMQPLLEKEAKVVPFFTPQAVAGLVNMLKRVGKNPISVLRTAKVVCANQVTARLAVGLGLAVDCVARDETDAAVLDCIRAVC
jgi:uroporphyrinogen III methyltransferase/synthase